MYTYHKITYIYVLFHTTNTRLLDHVTQRMVHRPAAAEAAGSFLKLPNLKPHPIG